MANIGLSLDEIIAKNKAQKKGRGQDSTFKSDNLRRGGGGGGGRRSGGRASGGGGTFTKRAPEGRWRHDKYAEEAAAARGAVLSASKPVRVNLSNLAPTVCTADLEELFDGYNMESAAVHYDEAGESLGTGDVYLKRRDAQRLLADFKGVAVDGFKLGMMLMDGAQGVGIGGGGGGSIASRVQFRSPRMVPGGGVRKRSSGGPNMGAPRRGGGGAAGGRGGARRGGKGEKKPKKTEEELDKELDAYMKKN